MPISGVVGTDPIMDSSGPNSLGGTYTGNPVACAATLAVLKVFEEENILVRGLALGEKLARRMAQGQERFSYVDNARPMGRSAAFEAGEDKESSKPLPAAGAPRPQEENNKHQDH